MVAVTHSPASAPPQAEILGVPLTLYDLPQLLAFIADAQPDERRLVLSGNVHSFNLAYENPWLRDFFRSADAVRLDGAGVRIAARLLGHAAPPRMTWADFAWPLAEMAAQQELTVFLLGSRPGVAEKAAARLQAHAPGLQIAGTHHGYFDKTPPRFRKFRGAASHSPGSARHCNRRLRDAAAGALAFAKPTRASRERHSDRRRSLRLHFRRAAAPAAVDDGQRAGVAGPFADRTSAAVEALRARQPALFLARAARTLWSIETRFFSRVSPSPHHPPAPAFAPAVAPPQFLGVSGLGSIACCACTDLVGGSGLCNLPAAACLAAAAA